MAECKSIRKWVKEDKTLGSGTFAVVTLWTNRLTGEQVAVKTFREDCRENCRKEIELIKKCAHPNVIKIVPIPEDLNQFSHRILSMEYCREGNLRKLLNQPQNCAGLPENIIRKCLKNMGDALEYVHKQNIIHRDLKPENIVLLRINNSVEFKLIDFGYSTECDSKNLLTSLVGTRDYAAPEMFKQYTFSADYWSFGFICHEIITGFRPFLPHLEPIVWIEQVRYKDDEVICVQERIYDDKDQNYIFSYHLFPDNHASKALVSELELWLRLALRWDYKKRGYNRQNQLVIFSALRDILEKKVLTVFDAVNYDTLDYHISDSSTILDLKKSISKDTGFPEDSQIILLPSGKQPTDDMKAVDVLDTSCKISQESSHPDPDLLPGYFAREAPTPKVDQSGGNSEFTMLYVFAADEKCKTLEPKKPPHLLVQMIENKNELLPYRKKRRLFVSSLHFLQTQLNLCKLFYEAMAVKVLSLSMVRDYLLSVEVQVQKELQKCEGVLELLRSSLLYNEKCYKNACESNAIICEPEFFADHIKKLASFDQMLEEYKTKLYLHNETIKKIQISMDETRAFENSDEIIKKLEKCLDKGYAFYKTNFLGHISKELKDSTGNCTELVKLMEEFFRIMECFVNDSRVMETLRKHKPCKDMIIYSISELENLCSQIRLLSESIKNGHLSLFKAVWSLKKQDASLIPSYPGNRLNNPTMDTTEPSDPALVTLLQVHRNLHQQVDDFMNKYNTTYNTIRSQEMK